jgi:DNA-binding CsgD family transcriptional regulator
MPRASSELLAVLDLYRNAQRLPVEAFATRAFEWIRARIPFDNSVIVTSLRGASWVDAHFCDTPDPAALMASYERVRHLDIFTAKMFANPGVALRHSHDAPDISGPRYKPFRDHLRRFDGRFIVSLALPNDAVDALTTVILVRGWNKSRKFTNRDARTLELIAPHVVEAFGVCRTRWLGASVGPGDDAPPLALVNSEGRFVQSTPAFVRIFWPDEPPPTSFVRPAVIDALRKGRGYPLPRGKHTLYGKEEATGGWLLRLRPQSAVDRLSAREREVAQLFANGSTYKAIAQKLSLAPATVRNHLQNVYAKLDVTERDALSALLAAG